MPQTDSQWEPPRELANLLTRARSRKGKSFTVTGKFFSIFFHANLPFHPFHFPLPPSHPSPTHTHRMSMAVPQRKSLSQSSRPTSLGRKSQGARTSTIGAPGNGPTSTIPSASSGLRSDPRPITDKGFMNASIRSLLNFLMSNGYDSTISPKILARPSSKDFNNIVTFLLRKVDENFNDGTVKFEDEVAMAFKSLGYPFNISKVSHSQSLSESQS